MNTNQVRAVAEIRSIPSGKRPEAEMARMPEAAEAVDHARPANAGKYEPSGCWWHHVCFDAAQQGEPY